MNQPSHATLETITLGGGCFWCLEAVFERVRGVQAVCSGYANGTVSQPSYEQVCTGETGAVEVVQLVFDPAVVSLETLLMVFFQVHDPTTINRQGADVGTQYRSGIYWHDPAQVAVAERAMSLAARAWSQPLVTELCPCASFQPAEAAHHRYFARNPAQRYCALVIAPKVLKAQAALGDLLKEPDVP